jgi:hypothetical protein
MGIAIIADVILRTRRFTHFSAVALRWLAIALLLAIPVGSGIAWAVGLAKRHAVVVLRRNMLGETGIDYLVEYGAINIDYISDWAGTPPRDGRLHSLPGLDVGRYVGVFNGQTRGYAELVFRVRWWLLLLANIPLILLSLRLAWPMLRRRVVPGHCPVCGYDLRATPDRCPECGTVPSAAT